MAANGIVKIVGNRRPALPRREGELLLTICHHAENEASAICDPQFAIDTMQVNFHGALSQRELPRDNFVGETV
jgi:hypothetical protein